MYLKIGDVFWWTGDPLFPLVNLSEDQRERNFVLEEPFSTAKVNILGGHARVYQQQHIYEIVPTTNFFLLVLISLDFSGQSKATYLPISSGLHVALLCYPAKDYMQRPASRYMREGLEKERPALMFGSVKEARP